MWLVWNAGYLQGQDSNSIWRGQMWKQERLLPETQSLQAQLASRKLRTFFFLSSSFTPSSEVFSAGQRQSCATEFVNQESDAK